MGTLIRGIAAQTIDRPVFDYAVTLLTTEGSEIRLETRFFIHDPEGNEWVYDPEAMAPNTAALLSLLHDKVDTADADEVTGRLSLEFRSGSRLEAHPHPAFEAWTYVGPGGERCVCLPGGGLSYWPPTIRA